MDAAPEDPDHEFHEANSKSVSKVLDKESDVDTPSEQLRDASKITNISLAEAARRSLSVPPLNASEDEVALNMPTQSFEMQSQFYRDLKQLNRALGRKGDAASLIW